MTDGPIHEDGSPEAPATERPFTHPLAAYEQPKNEDGTPRVDPRQALIDKIAQQNDEERTAPEGYVLHGVVPEKDGRAAGDLSAEELEAAKQVLEDGHTSEPMHPESEEKEPLPDKYANDPLADFIVMDGDEPMFRTVVEGQEQLIPLDKARRELQKRIAGDIRLQQNAEWQRQLEQREAALKANEQAWQEKTASPPPSSPDVDDVDFDAEAREVVSGLFTGSEEEAAAKLAKLLKGSRGATQATPAIDPEQIAQQAAAAARKQIEADTIKKDVETGWTKFQEDYPEIAQDENLFRYADGMTDAIAAENPEWLPSQVMQEAGRRTREWLKTIQSPEPSDQAPSNDRQERKRELRPMPRVRQGTPEKEPEEREPTPGDYIAELRKQRGQAV